MPALSCGVTLVRGPAAVALLLLLWRAMVVVQGINVTACCPPFRQHICYSFVKLFFLAKACCRIPFKLFLLLALSAFTVIGCFYLIESFGDR
jgi:hypothetical protein